MGYGNPCIRRAPLAAALPLLGLALSPLSILKAESVYEPSTRIAMSVTPDGSYSIQSEDPVWRCAGKLPTAAGALRIVDGVDGIGSYHEISFTFGTAREGSIRTYAARP